MSGVQFLAEAECFFKTLLQPSSETRPVSCSNITLGSYPNSKFSGSHSIEAEILLSLKVMSIQRQFTFYPRTHYDWINNVGRTYKNTTHHNIIMHYLEFIFLNCTAVMPPTLPLTVRCLSKFQFPFIWWWQIDLLMSSCIIHLSYYLLKKTVGILINYRHVAIATCFFMYTTIRLGLKLSFLQQFLIKLKISKLNGTRDFAFNTMKLKTC